jgi:putative addiction module CopG family antidote
MNVRLRPELEALIKQDVERGAYQSVDEYVERAVSMLHDQEAWLAENRGQIKSEIEEGYAAAQRGELIDDEQVRSVMKDRKSKLARE